jgi:hypothetical protein
MPVFYNSESEFRSFQNVSSLEGQSCSIFKEDCNSRNLGVLPCSENQFQISEKEVREISLVSIPLLEDQHGNTKRFDPKVDNISHRVWEA